jgi:hypothetical protein
VPLKTVIPPLTGISTLNSILIILDCLLMVNVEFFIHNFKRMRKKKRKHFLLFVAVVPAVKSSDGAWC